MSTFRELNIQQIQLKAQITKRCAEAWKKCKAAGIILHESRDEDGEDVMVPIKDSSRNSNEWKFEKYSTSTNHITLHGYIYVGGGEIEETIIELTYEEFDDLDASIAKRAEAYKAEQMKKEQQRAKAEAAEQAAEAKETENWERDTYIRLKAKFEGENHG
jgi:hypothetical protein